MKGRAYLEDALVAGEGLGDDRKNGAAARPVAAAREGRAGEERVRVREGEGLRNRGKGDEREGLSMSRPRAPLKAGAFEPETKPETFLIFIGEPEIL